MISVKVVLVDIFLFSVNYELKKMIIVVLSSDIFCISGFKIFD